MVVDGDIAKYAMWLFRQTEASREQLPALYDHLCQKNPLRSEILSYNEFEGLFQQWRWQEVASIDLAGDEEPAPAVDAETSESLSPDAVPVSDYHVVTEMLIEQLIASVKSYLADGWTPLGGITRAGSASSASYWAQAMVRNYVN